MVTNELLSYVKSEITKGNSQEIVQQVLLQRGWKLEDITSAFYQVTAETNTNPNPVSIQSLNVVANTQVFTEKDYPVTLLWVFKAPLIMILVSMIAFLFGYWFPYFVVAIPFFLIYNPLVRKNFHFALEEKFFKINQGILSKSQRELPYGVIQNVFVKQDLFDRLFGISSLAIENAASGGGAVTKNKWFRNSGNNQQEFLGAKGNKVSIPGLKKTHAEELKGKLLSKIKDNPIEDTKSGL